MNMFQPVKASTISEYINALPHERQSVIQELHKFIQKTVPTLKPYFATNMIGYGSFPYRNYKKELITWPVIALASQKNYISLYVCAIVDGNYLAETHKSELGNVSVGKSCIRFKKITDLNMPGLEKVLKLAEKHPGLRADS